MSSDDFYFDVGAFRMRLPAHAKVITHSQMAEDGSDAGPEWTVLLNNFELKVRLNDEKLSEFKQFIRKASKKPIRTRKKRVNGVPGVSYGEYGPPKTSIDWWFRSKGQTLCIRLQSAVFPFPTPTSHEIRDHNAIINSIAVRRRSFWAGLLGRSDR